MCHVGLVRTSQIFFQQYYLGDINHRHLLDAVFSFHPWVVSECRIYSNKLRNWIFSFPVTCIPMHKSEQVIDWLVTEYPILQHYFDSGEFTGYTAQQLPAAIRAEIRSFLRFYIMRRLLWCLGFVIVGAVLVIKSIAKEYEKKYSNSSRYTRHSSHSMSRKRF